MYAVIFKAEINSLDDAYVTSAKCMRDLAMGEYGCIDFTSVTEANQEISISYWESLDPTFRTLIFSFMNKLQYSVSP